MGERRGRFEAEVLVHLNAAYRFARWLAARHRTRRMRCRRRCCARTAPLRRCAAGREGMAARDRAQLPGEPALTREQPPRPRAAAGGARSAGRHARWSHRIRGPEAVAIGQDEGRSLDAPPGRLCPSIIARSWCSGRSRNWTIARSPRSSNVPIGTVMSRLSRARAALKAQWAAARRGRARKTCPDSQRLQAYFDAQLDAADAAHIERHLQDCAACRALPQDSSGPRALRAQFADLRTPQPLRARLVRVTRRRGKHGSPRPPAAGPPARAAVLARRARRRRARRVAAALALLRAVRPAGDRCSTSSSRRSRALAVPPGT